MADHAVRAFVAVPLSPEARDRVAEVQQRLRGPAGIKWVDPEAFHFTLRFLGASEPSVLAAIADDLQEDLGAEPTFSAALEGVGAFPNARRPKTIWVGVSEGSRELVHLASVAERIAVAHGFEPERRPFQAHLTLGRVKAERAPAELVRALEAEAGVGEVARMPVTEVVLMRSDLRPAGPIYTPLSVFALRSE